ncbi:MAG: class I SAM-dependent methyltransferase [Phycisphaerales bacterium]|nr:class I SAM-dependent methyltransferase [Phycisphaerales bacterium]
MDCDPQQRSLLFRDRAAKRYWWHTGPGAPAFIPPVYSSLSDDEWNLVAAWFEETERLNLAGECQVPLMSVMQGLIMGSQVRSIVQAGHYAGYSTLLVGFMLRRMGFRRSLFTIDIDRMSCDFTASWVERAGLLEYVHIEQRDSADPSLPGLAEQYFGEAPRLVFIDSAHTYGQTRRELELWFPRLCPGGFLICHDSSAFAAAFDSTGQGGVVRAVTEWKAEHPEAQCMAISGPTTFPGRDAVYEDVCGAFLAQKPGPARGSP